MSKEAGLARGQHLRPCGLEVSPSSSRQRELVNEWALVRKPGGPGEAEVLAAGRQRGRG